MTFDDGRTYIHKHIHIYAYIQKYTYIYICIHTYMHTYIHIYIHTYINKYIHTYGRPHCIIGIHHSTLFKPVIITDTRWNDDVTLVLL